MRETVRDAIAFCRDVLDDLSQPAAVPDVQWEKSEFDEFWLVEPEDAFGHVEPPDLVIGSLAEDMAALRRARRRVDEDRNSGHELRCVATLLSFVSYLLTSAPGSRSGSRPVLSLISSEPARPASTRRRQGRSAAV